MADAAPAIRSEELVGLPIPDLGFASTAESPVRLGDASLGDFVVFIYPRIARPDDAAVAEWLLIPGAKGCTAESCEFRDLADDFQQIGLSIYGLSTQDTEEQAQASERLHLSYPLLSDPGLELRQALRLPTFTFEGQQMYKRSTLVVRSAAIAVAHLQITDARSHPRQLLAQLRRLDDRY